MGGRKKLEGPGVDYYQLPRKQLQSLCKKYGFPANKTNILMAEFLTSHLNSDEYLNRDKSLPSPAVKTRYQRRDEESTTDDSLPTISELQPTGSGTLARDLSHDFISNDAERTDDQAPEASKAEETSREPLEICVVSAIGSPLEEEMDFTNASFRIRHSCLGHKDVSRPATPVRSTTEESRDCTIKGSEVEGCVVEVRHLSTSQAITDATTTVDFGKSEFPVESQKEPGEETPLPLSVMPHVLPITPSRYASPAGKGVKLFVNVVTDSGVLPSEKLRDNYRAWGAPLTTRTDQDKTHEDIISGSLKPYGSESNGSLVLEGQLDTVLNRTDRAEKEEDGIESLLLQASMASTTDATAMKSCLTPSRKVSSTLNVSILCPPVVSSRRSIADLAGRSGIVKEWTDEQNQEKTFDQIIEIPRSSKEQPDNDELVFKALDQPSPLQDLIALETSEVNERTPRDLEIPPEGIVEKAGSIYEEHKLSTRGASSMQRKDSYKSSPFLKSSRIAAELERASKLGHTRRSGILALKRAMGVASLFSDSAKEDADKESAADGATSSPLPDSPAIEGIVAGNENTSTTPLIACVDPMEVQDDQVSETEIFPSDTEVKATPENLSSRTVNALVVTNHSTGSEDTILSTEEGIVGMDEQTTVPRIGAATASNVEESDMPLDAEGVNLQAKVEEVVSNLTWMTKPSPFLKSSRIAAELKRASKLGHTGRVGILASKRAMGVAPLFSDSAKEDVDKESAADGATSSPLSDSPATEGIVDGSENTRTTPLLACADPRRVQDDQDSETELSPSDMEVKATPENLSSTTVNALVVTGSEDSIFSTEEGVVDMDEQTTVPRIGAATGSNAEESDMPLDADEGVNLQAKVEEVVSNLTWMTKPMQLPIRRPLNQKLKEKPERPFSTNGRTLGRMERASAKLKMLKKSAAVREEGVVSRPRRSTSIASVDEVQIQACALQLEPAREVTIVEQTTENPITRLEKRLDTSSQLDEVGISDELVGQNGKMRIAIEEEKNLRGHSETFESLSFERHSVCEDFSKSEEKKASEKPTVALSFLAIDFTESVGKQNDVLQFPGSVSETDSAKFTTEKTIAENFTPLSPLDSNRLAIADLRLGELTTPTKPSGILSDVLSEGEEKNNADGLSFYGKENEWFKRQEQHKTPLTGRSKEKALRTAEIKAASLREQLLRKRRGMLEEEKMGADSSVSI